MYTLDIFESPFFIKKIKFEATLYGEDAVAIAQFHDASMAINMAKEFGWEITREEIK